VGALVTAIGAEAVANALVAAAWARLYLEDDKLDIRVVLTAQRLQKTGGDGQTQQLATTLMKVRR
jgi:stage V sporulation protein SpoVS